MCQHPSALGSQPVCSWHEGNLPAIEKTLSARGEKMLMRLASCLKCDGDLVLEEDEWRCLQCGRYYYPRKPLAFESPIRARKRKITVTDSLIEAAGTTPLVGSARLGDGRWGSRNDEVIAHLAAGRAVQEVARLTGRNPRRIGPVRERLAEAASD
jgi:hypothetical protein